MPKRQCKAPPEDGLRCKEIAKSTGERCQRAAGEGRDYCGAHDPTLPADKRFGSPEQAREAATGVKRRYPRLREVMERQLEEHAERIIGAQIEALQAVRGVVVGDGTEDAHVEMVPDFLTRLRAGETLTSRAFGKPGTDAETAGESPLVNINLIADPNVRDALSTVRARLGASRSVESGRFDAGDRAAVDVSEASSGS